MALKFVAKLRNPRNRNYLLLGGFLLIIIIIILYFSNKKSDVLGAQASKTSAPPQITSIPGGTTSARYQQLQEEENKKRAEAAKKSGTSAVATIIGARSKDSLSGKESFGIEGLLGPQTPTTCNCGPQIAPDVATSLMNQLAANPDGALDLLRKNQGLAGLLCKQDPELAIKIMEKNISTAKIILRQCPELARILAQRDPALFKQLMLDDPELAKLIAASDPELMKQLLLSDPDFARKMAATNPDLIKDLMKNDPDFANKMAKAYPDLVKQLMKNDPAFAKAMMQNNPQMVKDLMLNDPDFARAMALNNPDAVKALMDGDPAFAKALLAKVPDIKDILKTKLSPAPTNDQERLKAQEDAKKRDEDAKQRARDAEAAARLQAQQADQYQKQLQALASAMETQSKAVFQSWNEVTLQQFTQGNASKNGGTGLEGAEGPLQLGSSANGADNSKSGPAIIKAGTIMFASLDTAVDSDEPGPVMATIVTGPLKGAKVLGTMTTTNIAGSFPERVTLNFTTLSVPTQEKSSNIQAVAIDPDTARTALATDVDHHYLLRYSAMFAAAFMKGYAQVLTSQGTTTTTATNGLATSTQSPNLPTSQQLLAALGEVGKKWGEAVQDYVKRPYTIVVAAGTGIGLLFLSDVTESS